MSIYLIRHTTPLIEKGICYGQADLDVSPAFAAEAALIKQVLPEDIATVYTSPLQRCRKLATHLFPAGTLHEEADLKEIHCGEWELKHWDAIPRDVIDPWMNDFVNVCIPGGESYVQVFNRVQACFKKISSGPRPVAIVTHGGVIRSILSYITETPLINSFKAFSLHYGCVVKLDLAGELWKHAVLLNPDSVKEQHKPSYFKTPG